MSKNTKKNGPINVNPSMAKSVESLVAGRRGLSPLPAQVAGAPQVAAELRAAKQYGADFAAPCPRAEEVASALEAASTLSAEEVALLKRLSALAHERRVAWNTALAGVEVLARLVEARGLVDGAIESRYPALAAFIHARDAVTARASATKRKTKREASAKKAATPASPTPTPTADASPTTH